MVLLKCCQDISILFKIFCSKSHMSMQQVDGTIYDGKVTV
jgi:hypothetical protein